MADTVALFRCVCGADIPFIRGRQVNCPRCGRRHNPEAMGPASLDTVVLSKSRVAQAVPAAGVELPPEPEPRPSLIGQTFDHFQIIEELGQGGVGTVYRALDTSLERYVALKVLREEGDPAAHETFVHEARAQARLNHPGIATIYFIGRRADIPYFAMEYVPGNNLEVRLRQGPLPPSETVRIGLQAVKALGEAHLHGITHRDIKPGNFIQTSTGVIKLTDFGLSKTEGGGLQITGRNSITGTPYYIAPEQARGESTDLRTDIYSLGAMLYHLAYGKPPFEGDNFLSVISKHLTSPVEFPARPPAGLPAGFPDVISRMMAKEPEKRFQDYEALERALRELLPESQVVAALYRRAGTVILDWTVLCLLILLAAGMVALAEETLKWNKGWVNAVPEVTYWATLLASLAYQLIAGRTGGKQFAKIRIAAIRGGRPSRLKLLARWFFQWLPLLALWVNDFAETRPTLVHVLLAAAIAFWAIDHLWALTNRRRRTLHDLLCGTWVLEDRAWT
jgi:uncharacterized RDD family membrane protein YckC